MFDPTVTYASMSNNMVNKILASADSGRLKDNYVAASEITSKMDRNMFAYFRSLVDKYGYSYSEVKKVISKISNSLIVELNATNTHLKEIRNAYSTKERMYRYQLYSIEKNFLRAFEAMEERTLNNVADSFIEFAMKMTRWIRRLANDYEANTDNMPVLYALVYDELQTRQEICILARENISDFVTAYTEGKPIFSYKFEDIPREHNLYIVPRTLLNYSMHHNNYMIEHLPRLKTTAFDVINNSLEMLKEQANAAYETGVINETWLHTAEDLFCEGCRIFRYSKSVVYTLGVTLPLKVIEERRTTFNEAWADYNNKVTEIKQNIGSLNAVVQNITANVLPRLDNLFEYLDTYSPESNSTLMDFASVFLSDEMNGFTNILKDFFREVHTRGHLISDLLSLIKTPVFTIWTQIIDDVDSLEYYKYTQNELFLRNLTEVLSEWGEKIRNQKSRDMRNYILHADEDFFSSLGDLVIYLKDFNDSLVIDSNFVK